MLCTGLRIAYLPAFYDAPSTHCTICATDAAIAACESRDEFELSYEDAFTFSGNNSAEQLVRATADKTPTAACLTLAPH